MTKWTWFIVIGIALWWFLARKGGAVFSGAAVTGAAGGMTTGTTSVTAP